MTSAFEATLRQAPLLPVLTVADAAHAAPLARALAEGGLTAVEVTLRTPAALEAIRAMREAAPGLLVGAGTLLATADVEAAAAAGAQFLVTPGCTPTLAAALRASGLPACPGVATPSEAMARMDEGFEIVKFFPAEPYGGAPTLKAMAAPIARLKVIPTGGIDAAKAKAYLAMPFIVAVGGSWMTPPEAIAAGDWAGVTAKTREALAALQ